MSADDGRESDGPRTATWKLFVFDVASALAGVLLVGGLLLAVSGVWPPLVAIESPSMEPNIDTGDLVFVMDEERFPGEDAHADTGVVTHRAGAAVGYTKFSKPGDVIVFEPDGDDDTTPIIHRAMLWVDDEERWYSKANPDYVMGYSSCEEMPNCPAPNEGFITKGDNNANYDQINGKDPVKPEWVIGTAEMRVPGLGQLRLGLEGLASGAPGNSSPTHGSESRDAETPGIEALGSIGDVPVEANGSSSIAASG